MYVSTEQACAQTEVDEKEFTVAMPLSSLSIFLVLSQKSHVINNLIKYFFSILLKAQN